MSNSEKNQIFKNNNFTLSHRNDTDYPGYLIFSINSDKLCQQDEVTQSELGVVLSKIENGLIKLCSPFKIIISRYGFSKGYNFHLHIVPIYKRIVEHYYADERVSQVQKILNCKTSHDGVDLMLFIVRDFCDNSLKLPSGLPERNGLIQSLKNEFSEI